MNLKNWFTKTNPRFAGIFLIVSRETAIKNQYKKLLLKPIKYSKLILVEKKNTWLLSDVFTNSTIYS